jgi:hypothetical protein
MEFIENANKKKRSPIKLMLYILTGVFIFQAIYIFIDTQLYIAKKKSTCFVYRTINELIND